MNKLDIIHFLFSASAKGRNKELENIIYKEPNFIFYYARNVLQGRWPKAEKYILSDEDFSYDYYSEFIDNNRLFKRSIINKIKLNAEKAYFIVSKINGRFPKLEKLLFNDNLYSLLYVINYVKKPSYIINHIKEFKNVNTEFVEDYLKLLNKRYIKLEIIFNHLFLKKNYSNHIYMKKVLKFNHD